MTFPSLARRLWVITQQASYGHSALEAASAGWLQQLGHSGTYAQVQNFWQCVGHHLSPYGLSRLALTALSHCIRLSLRVRLLLHHDIVFDCTFAAQRAAP